MRVGMRNEEETSSGNVDTRETKTDGERRSATRRAGKMRYDDDGASGTAREMRGRASDGEGFKYKYIPRHAPSYHIDLAIVTILSSPAMSGCTITAGGKEMPASEEPCGRARGEWEEMVVREGREREAGRTAWCTTPPHDARGYGPPRVECESESKAGGSKAPQRMTKKGNRRGRRRREQERGSREREKQEREKGAKGGLRETDSVVGDRGRNDDTGVRSGGGE